MCEVMLRDMTDSKRIDQHVQSQKKVSGAAFRRAWCTSSYDNLFQMILHPTIISRHFWPPLQAGKFNMPGQFKQYVARGITLQTMPTLHYVGSRTTTRGSSIRSSRTRSSAGSRSSGRSTSKLSSRTARSRRTSRPSRPRSSSFSQREVSLSAAIYNTDIDCR